MTRVIFITSILFAVSISVTLSLFFPNILANNKFLLEFSGPNMIAVLVIIMTITFASVANIGLTVSRIQGSIKDATERQRVRDEIADPLRAETRSSAWLLFAATAAAFAISLAKGWAAENIHILSLSHGLSLTILMIFGMVLYDIYSTIFELVGLATEVGADEGDHGGNVPKS